MENTASTKKEILHIIFGIFTKNYNIRNWKSNKIFKKTKDVQPYTKVKGNLNRLTEHKMYKTCECTELSQINLLRGE